MAESFIRITRRVKEPGEPELITERWLRWDHILEVATRVDVNRARQPEVVAGCTIITSQGGQYVADESIEDIFAALGRLGHIDIPKEDDA